MQNDKKAWPDALLLRHLAGRYFLIKKNQTYPGYIKPLETDESGKEFWELLCRYPDQIEEAAGELAARYDIDSKQTLSDLSGFKEQIRNYFEI